MNWFIGVIGTVFIGLAFVIAWELIECRAELDAKQEALTNALRENQLLTVGKERLQQQIEESDPISLFDPGWTALYKQGINREPGDWFDIGNCPGDSCYIFRFAEEFIEDERRFKKIQLTGGGFGGRGGKMKVIVSFTCQTSGRMSVLGHERKFAILELTKGARRPFVCDDYDFLIVTMDTDPLVVGIAQYPGTKKLYGMGHRRFSSGFGKSTER